MDGGALALVSYFGLQEPCSAGDQQALRAAMARAAPELAADWPTYRDLDSTLEGVDERRGNVSEVWGWLGGYELARGYPADLFDNTQAAAVPTLLEHTADALNALLGTMSFWARLSPRQRDALRAENHALHQKARPADPLQHRRLPGNGPTRSAHLTALRHLAQQTHSSDRHAGSVAIGVTFAFAMALVSQARPLRRRSKRPGWDPSAV